jgi:hypothetical protein
MTQAPPYRGSFPANPNTDLKEREKALAAGVSICLTLALLIDK